MSFISQLSQSRVSTSRVGSDVKVTQSYKPSSDVEELSIRITAKLLSRASMKVGDFVDVLYDKESDRWMIKKVESGLKITGKSDAPTGLVRYTLKDGHAKFTDNRSVLPVIKMSLDNLTEVSNGALIFKLNMEGDNNESEVLK